MMDREIKAIIEGLADEYGASLRSRRMPTGKANDAARPLPPGYVQYHLCSDGVLRTAVQIVAWKLRGSDYLSEMRASLQRKHCGGVCSTGHRVGHLCSCR
jgi:hypothetical protein